MLSFKEFFSDQVEEQMSISARRATGRRTKRLSTRINRMKKRKLKRVASKDTINKRSVRRTRDELFRKYSGGKSRQDVNVSRRKAIEKKIKRMSNVVKNRSVRKRADTRKLDRSRKGSS